VVPDGAGRRAVRARPRPVPPCLVPAAAVHHARGVEVLTAPASEDQQRRIAGGLRARGVDPGDRVVLGTSSSGAMLSAILGALRVGIVPVVLNAGLLDHERAALVADARPRLVIDDASLAELLTAAPTDLAPHPLARPMHYTSGTTGTPKGVWSGLLTESEARALATEEAEQWEFAADDVHLVNSPFHHSVAIRFGGGTLLAGGTVVVAGRFDAVAAAAALAEHRPTTTFLVPAHLQRLFALGTRPDASSLRLVVHAGAPCPAPLKHRAIEAFGAERLWEFYGSTEGQFTACPATEWLDRPGTVGRARAGRTLEIDGDEQGLDRGGNGTVWCTVPPYARFGYWRDDERTDRAWRPPAPSRPDAFGAFTVGDLGRLDPAGYLFLEGRRDDLVITGGVNVYPAEVEQVLNGLAGVEQVAVFGVDDERWGQRVCAAVVGTVDAAAVHRWAGERLAGYKRPKDVYVVEALPHTSTGKVQRRRLPAALGLDRAADT
jgi:long-chain acyl-CoA synthetase